MMEDEDDCPELVPINTQPAPPAQKIPVTIITGYLGEICLIMASMSLERKLTCQANQLDIQIGSFNLEALLY